MILFDVNNATRCDKSAYFGFEGAPKKTVIYHQAQLM